MIFFKERFKKFFTFSIKEKLSIIILFLMMILAFSLAFGYIYGKYIVLIAFILWLFVIKKNDLKRIFNNKIIIVLIMLILFHYISILWSQDVSGAISYSNSIVRYIFVPILIIGTIIRKEQLKYIISAFIFGMFINEVISYLIFFDLIHTNISMKYGYPIGFVHHVRYSVLVAFTAILILYQLRYTKNSYLQVLYAVFFITMTANLLISGGRTGYVVYFGSLFILSFTYFKLNIKNILFLLVFPLIVFSVGFSMNKNVQSRVLMAIQAIEKIYNSNNYNTSFGARLAFYPITIDIMKEKKNNAFFGVGAGDSKEEIKDSIKRLKNIIPSNIKHAHNSYIEMYLNVGVIGLYLYLLFFVYLIRVKIKDKEINFVRQAFISIFMIATLADHLFRAKETMFFMGIFVAIVIVQYQHEQKSKKLSLKSNI